MIIALDTNSFGFHFVTDHGEFGHRQAPRDMDIELRRSLTFREARTFFASGSLQRYEEIDVFCEEPLSLQNGKTSRLLALSAGVIFAGFVLGADEHPQMRWHWVNVASWKRRIVGNGGARKEKIQEFVRNGGANFEAFVQGNAHGYGPDLVEKMFDEEKDLFDAFCIMRYGEWFVSQATEGE